MSAGSHTGRRRRALEQAERAGLAGLLVAPGADLVYLIGHEPPPLERLTLLILQVEREPVLLVPELERPAAELAPGADGVAITSWRDGDDPHALAAELLGPGRYAVSDQTWASHLLGLQASASGASFVAAGASMPLLRAVKDEEEVARLRAAARGADAAFDVVVGLAFAGRREVDVAEDLDRLLRAHGHEHVDFTIVGSGPNGASPHHAAADRVIEPGDAVVLDFGGRVRGYCSDITRTVFVGEPGREELEVYDVVRAAQQAAFEAVRPGVAAQDVDRAARAVIVEAGHGERFVHRTGHGIGIELHEPPYIVEGDTTPLEAGMTFSDEPGVYLPGRFGVRIEDQLVVTPAGAERLNEASRDPTVVV